MQVLCDLQPLFSLFKCQTPVLIKSFDDVLKLIDDYGDDFINTYKKYGDDAARAIESGIEPSIINRLAEVEVTPSLYETLRITSPESAESLLGAIERRISRTATQADIDLISLLRIKYNARATRNIAFAKGNIRVSIPHRTKHY